MMNKNHTTSHQTFMHVLSRDEAQQRFQAVVQPRALGSEVIGIDEAWGRTLAEDVVATVNVPSFDRSNFDGFAVRAADLEGAREDAPVRLGLRAESVRTGSEPRAAIESGQAMRIATGGMVPRGADAIVLVEDCHVVTRSREAGVTGSREAGVSGVLEAGQAVAAGHGIATAGSDLAIGETVLSAGMVLSSRETGVLAAIGRARVSVWRRPRVAIVSTGDEIIAPGEVMRPAKVFDSNARILADAVRECGGQPWELGIAVDDESQLRAAVTQGLQEADVVLLSGGTSKGEGDLCYRVVAELDDPGIVVHGVALKPGKPICLAASRGKPVVVLPGFPTSAIFTFHEFVAPIIRRLAAVAPRQRRVLQAELAQRLVSESGRTEYTLVGLVPRADGGVDDASGYFAYPMGKGSGSVSTFSMADGFFAIDRETEMVPAGAQVEVQLIGESVEPPELVVMGSHCPGLDRILARLRQAGRRIKFFAVGSLAGLRAAQQGRCDLAGVHLFDPETETYNRPFLDERVSFVSGYRRRQGLVVRREDAERHGQAVGALKEWILSEPGCRMVNRNQGSGTRLHIDRFLEGHRPEGYALQVHHHTAVAAAVSQGRADWGMAIEAVCPDDCCFIPLEDEHFDFVIPRERTERAPMREFLALLGDAAVREELGGLGFEFG